MGIKVTVTLKDGSKLLEDIARTGCTQSKFAERIGISQPYLNQIINQEKNPGPAIAKKITDGLGKKLEDYFFIQTGC